MCKSGELYNKSFLSNFRVTITIHLLRCDLSVAGPTKCPQVLEAA